MFPDLCACPKNMGWPCFECVCFWLLGAAPGLILVHIFSVWSLTTRILTPLGKWVQIGGPSAQGTGKGLRKC